MMALEALIISEEILASDQEELLKQLRALVQEKNHELVAVHFLSNDFQMLVNAYRQARGHNRMTLSFGGIGGGAQERVRAAVATACETRLAVHQQADAFLLKMFGDRYLPRHRELVNFPVHSRLIPNPITYVPGFSYANIFCMPLNIKSALPMCQWLLDKYAKQPETIKSYYCALLLKCSEYQAMKLKHHLDNIYPLANILVLPRENQEVELAFEGEISQAIAAFNTAKVLVASQGIHFRSQTSQNLPPKD